MAIRPGFAGPAVRRTGTPGRRLGSQSVFPRRCLAPEPPLAGEPVPVRTSDLAPRQDGQPGVQRLSGFAGWCKYRARCLIRIPAARGKGRCAGKCNHLASAPAFLWFRSMLKAALRQYCPSLVLARGTRAGWRRGAKQPFSSLRACGPATWCAPGSSGPAARSLQQSILAHCPYCAKARGARHIALSIRPRRAPDQLISQNPAAQASRPVSIECAS